MNPLTRLLAWFRPPPKTAEELQAEQDAARMHDEMETTRLSQRSLAGSNYETRRGSDPDNY
jgi:hypothetical protein